MSVSHSSSVSRRPVGGQVNANSGQPSSPVTSHASKTTSVSPDIPYDIWVGPDIPFRPANAPTTPAALLTVYNPSAMAEQNQTVMENAIPPAQFTEPQLGSVELSSTGPGDQNNVPSWQPAPTEESYMTHSTLEVVPEAYFNNFWSPEPKAAPKPPPGPPPDFQNAPQSNVSSTGWAVASPEPQQSQSSAHPAPIPQSQNQYQSNMSSTGWVAPPPNSFQNQLQNQSPSHSPASIQPRPGSTVSSSGWPGASPAPSPHQSLSQPASNVQHRPQSTVSSTGWAVASPEPFPNQNAGAPHYPPSEDLSPLSMSGMAQASAPPTQFSRVQTPSSASSPMTTPSISGAEPIRRQSAAMSTPSRMPSNARPPVLNHNQPRSLESISFASVCCQCTNAILYNTYYYNCTYCKLDICGTCFQGSTHPWTHLPSMVRLNAQETKAGDRREDKQCQSCKAMKHRRMDCDECPYSVCLSCYSNAAVPTHQHKSFKLKATPGLTLCVRRGDGSPCCTKPSFGHCGRCYTPWKPEEWMVQCKTCLFEFEEVVALCLQCDSEILSACRQSQHQMVSMKCRQKLRSEQGGNTQASVECTECAIQFQSMTDISFLRHPHANYDFLFFTEDREQLFAAVYRSCKKKSARTDTPLPPSATTTKCTYCNHNVPTNMIQSCLPCNTVKYCTHCYSIAAPSHHHGPSSFVSQRDILQTQLGGGWNQRKNLAGRIWYHHPRTNTHSFDFPQSALGQPEPLPSPTTQGFNQNSIKPENHRRATTGGIPSRPTGPLPPGWEARKTPDGRRYYANHSTKQTSWQRPASMPRRPNVGQRLGSAPLQNHGEAVAQLTPEQKAAAKAEAQAKAKRQQIYTKIGTSVLKGVVSGVIS